MVYPDKVNFTYSIEEISTENSSFSTTVKYRSALNLEHYFLVDIVNIVGNNETYYDIKIESVTFEIGLASDTPLNLNTTLLYLSKDNINKRLGEEFNVSGIKGIAYNVMSVEDNTTQPSENFTITLASSLSGSVIFKEDNPLAWGGSYSATLCKEEDRKLTKVIDLEVSKFESRGQKGFKIAESTLQTASFSTKNKDESKQLFNEQTNYFI